MARVAWFREAHDDLRAVGDSLVVVEIMDLAERELEEAPATTSITGSLPDDSRIKWRRCVRHADRQHFESFEAATDDDDFSVAAHDFVLVYRQLLPDEAIANRLAENLLVLRVLSNRQLLALIQ